MSDDKTPLLLSVNIDHIATLRQARGAPYPDPVEAAAVAEQAGAAGITVHLRGDRRHIQDSDVHRLRPVVCGKLNLEIAATGEMIDLACVLRPDQVTLVPERPDEITTEGGLDVVEHEDVLRRAAARLAESEIDVSMFIDPDPRQIEVLAAFNREHVGGFEINTDAYTKATLGSTRRAIERKLQAIRNVASQGADLGLRVHAGHGLTSDNVGPVAAVPQIEELNIGHWMISRAAIVGLEQSVHEMLGAMAAGRSD